MDTAQGVEVRSLEADEIDSFVAAYDTAVGVRARREEVDKRRLLFELDRAIAALEGEEIIGTARAHSLELSVPGGVVATAALTSIAVLPTHRRHGVLSTLLRRMIDDVRGRGESIAILAPPDGATYGRYGFGSAVAAATVEIDRHWGTFAARIDSDGTVRLVDRDAAFEEMPAVYDAVRRDQPGMLTRYGRWWDQRLPETPAGGAAPPTFYALHYSSASGGTDGYVAYCLRPSAGDSGATVDIIELMAASIEAYASLWRFCFAVDAASSVTATMRPADEPLQWMLADPRRLRLRARDHIWLRIIDLPEALVARGYRAHDRLVLQVTDSFCKWNEGKVELISSADGIECGPVSESSDLVVDCEDLAAAYLGATTFTELARAGRVVERTKGALARADGMFGTGKLPWCPTNF